MEYQREVVAVVAIVVGDVRAGESALNSMILCLLNCCENAFG